MAIIIKNIRMPREKMSTCIVVQNDGGVLFADGVYEQQVSGLYSWKKAEAIEVPRHVRLIDANQFEVFSYTETEGRPDTFDEGVKFVLEKIDSMPTVIDGV